MNGIRLGIHLLEGASLISNMTLGLEHHKGEHELIASIGNLGISFDCWVKAVNFEATSNRLGSNLLEGL